MALSKDNFKVEKSGSVATVTCEDDNAFFDTDLTKKQIKDVFDHAHGYIEKAANVAADMATDIMKKDKKVNEVSFALPYGVSKRGGLNIQARRSTTFRGVGDRPDVTRSDLRVAVKDPMSKVSKTKLKAMQARMTEELLGK